MSDRPTPREIAFRLITAWRAGPDVYRSERAALALTTADAGSLINDLVHISGALLSLVTEHRDELEEDVSAEDLVLVIERVLDRDDPRSPDRA